VTQIFHFIRAKYTFTRVDPEADIVEGLQNAFDVQNVLLEGGAGNEYVVHVGPRAL
jgi:hypothetical protein